MKFRFTLEYETTVEQYEEGYLLEREIGLKKEYLETQREDLTDALSNADLLNVEIFHIENLFESELALDYSI